jgi:hypothetical protein
LPQRSIAAVSNLKLSQGHSMPTRRRKIKNSSDDKPPGKKRSSLYDRSNGFLLGCFLALLRFKFARDNYRIHRSRVHEFFEEAGITFRLPPSAGAYSRVADALQLKAAKACAARSVEMSRFMMIGAFAARDGMLRAMGKSASDELRATAIGLLERNKLKGKKLYDRFLTRVAHLAEETGAAPGDTTVQTIMTPAMELLASTLEPLGPDGAMCFVAMPFSPPHVDYFRCFYRPLASHLECDAFRMWGGLSGEAYVELMLTIMRRCKFVIAELSGANANVLYEFGVARGLDKRVIPLCQTRYSKRLPSNITSDQLFQVYSPREKEWPQGTVLRCAAQVALVDFAVEITEDRLKKARWVAGQQLPQLPAEDQ